MKFSSVSVLLSVTAFFLAAARINHGLVDSSLPVGPGLTLDESFNIEQGIYLFDAVVTHGPGILNPATAQDVFGSKRYFSDHVPLIRFLLGTAHEGLAWLIPGAEQSVYNVPAARLGSCLLFAVTVLVLCELARRLYGMQTAVVAAVLLMLMPRVVGHARLASLETGTMLTWLTAVVPLMTWWTGERPPTTRQCVISGLMFGLLLLSKVQGILLPPLAVVWALVSFRKRSIRPLLIWGLVAGTVLFVGWPWLWLDPIGHLQQYLGKTTDRPPIHVWYFGHRYVDKHLPWHFPFVMTAVTVPVTVLLGLVLRGCQRSLERTEILLSATVLWPLIVFAIPGTPVYDGTRLFLVIMPGIALLAARGIVLFFCQTGSRSAMAVAAAVLLATTAATVPRVLSPVALCDYNLLTGGPRGAFAIGMETDYWSSGLNGEFWKQVPANSTIYVAPVSHQFQLQDLEHLVPMVSRKNVQLVPFKYDPQAQRGLVLLIHRLADLPRHLRSGPDGADVVASGTWHGVILYRLVDTTRATWPQTTNWPPDEQ
ncbi:MAG: glycosyltransferase family 39 protein [Planctomycetaceae bacterium]